MTFIKSQNFYLRKDFFTQNAKFLIANISTYMVFQFERFHSIVIYSNSPWHNPLTKLATITKISDMLAVRVMDNIVTDQPIPNIHSTSSPPCLSDNCPPII